MKLILQNSNLVFSTSIGNLTNLWGDAYVNLTGTFEVQNNANSFWAPNDVVNSASVGRTIYGVTFKSSSPNKTFKVALAEFTQPESSTSTVDAAANIKKIMTFTTSKTNDIEQFLFDESITISNVNERICVSESGEAKWGGIQAYLAVNQLRIVDEQIKTSQYIYCQKLFFNLLVEG